MYPNHHALLYFGLENFNLPQFKTEKQKTHDIVVQNFNELRIDDARKIISLALQTPIHLNKQCFVIVANSIAVEAQNALLKLLEEPPEVSSFVFILPDNNLLPTLRSRFMIMTEVFNQKTTSEVFAKFIASSIPDRLALISTIIEKKDTEELIFLRESLICYLQVKGEGLSATQLQRLHWLILQMQLRGASLKMLWEDVAFTLPVEV